MREVSLTISGTEPEDAQISSILMVGAHKDHNGFPSGINKSILQRFLASLEELKIPTEEQLQNFKRFTNIMGLPAGHVETIDLNKDQGGIDFFNTDPKTKQTQSVIMCGIPRNPEDHSIEGPLGDLFTHSMYHHSEDNWYNFRKKIDELHPDILFCAGGNDCMSWKEMIGPNYVALTDKEYEQGMLFSKSYLGKNSAYLMLVQSPLCDVAFSDEHIFQKSDIGTTFRFEADRLINPETLWPQTLG